MEGVLAGKRRAALMGIGLSAALLITLVVSVSLGDMRIPPLRVARIILTRILNDSRALASFPRNELAVVLEIRLPRVLSGLFVGAGLAAAGAIFQSLLGSPLADP